MALFPKTPGVYVQEISTLPPSVAAVGTAIPAFIGYTEKGKKNTVMSPVRIESLLEFTNIFGGPLNENYQASISIAGALSIAPATSFSEFTLYRNLQMFYANGGGPCYIVSVGNYFDSIADGQSAAPPLGLLGGIARLEEADEPTLVVIPEATASAVTFLTINNAMIDHCAKLQDRFAILDVKHGSTNTIVQDANAFRSAVTSNTLKYGASYYPPLNTALSRPYSDFDTKVVDSRGTPVYVTPYNNLFSIKNGFAASASIDGSSIAAGEDITINSVLFKEGVDFVLGANVTETAINLKTAINRSALNGIVVAITAGQTAGTIVLLAGNSITATAGYTIASSTITFTPFVAGTGANINTGLYNDFIAKLDAQKLTLHPSATMAGIYTAVDNSRGVWKAPANVSLNFVNSLSVVISDTDQEGLNVDPTGGKSINAIRDFMGRGTLVWGARTLDGNSNEWRYVNVRRLFIMVEESCKKASEFVVFEPNDKNTWLRVKGTISNFLTNLWRDGALAGDKPEQAFFVKVGLNETMTAQDILEGKLIVQVGMAAVRPAEFIILQFMHKLQEA